MPRKLQKRLGQYRARAGISKLKNAIPLASVIILVAFVGIHLIFTGHAATFATSKDAENGTLTGAAVIKNGANASGGKFVKFGSCTVTSNLVNTCRPWFGGAASGNPGTPAEQKAGTGPAGDDISQINYLQKLTGSNTSYDFVRNYNACDLDTTIGSNGLYTYSCRYGVPMVSTGNEYYWASHGKYVNVVWEPTHTWSQATGVGNPNLSLEQKSMNQEITDVANNFLAFQRQHPGTKFLLTVYKEPQIDVTQSTTDCPSRAKTSGSPLEYREMWRNVHDIFAQVGVTDVRWAMDYVSQAQSTFDCIAPEMWPGNNYVDWILFDTYSNDNHATWETSGAAMYDNIASLQGLSGPYGGTIDVNSKPWGLGETGTCVDTDIPASVDFYKQADTAFKNNDQPNYKLYMVWADNINGNGGTGCLTDYDDGGTTAAYYDPTKQAAFNIWASDILNSGN